MGGAFCAMEVSTESVPNYSFENIGVRLEGVNRLRRRLRRLPPRLMRNIARTGRCAPETRLLIIRLAPKHVAAGDLADRFRTSARWRKPRTSSAWSVAAVPR